MAIPRIPKDAEAPEPKGFDDGSYKVVGFEWFSKNDDGAPCLVAQKNGLVGRVKFGLADGEEGPPMSVTLAQMALLANAFGVDGEALGGKPSLDQPRAIAKYMTRVRDKVNGEGKELKIKVENGWVDSQRGVPGMSLPSGEFLFVITDMGPKEDGVPTPRDGQWGSWFLVTFRVVAGKGGKPSLYDGCEFTEFLTYALVSDVEGQLDWEKDDGSWTGNSIKMGHLLEYTTPELFEGSFADPDNILPEWLDQALELQYVVSAYRTPKTSGKRKGEIAVNWATLEPVQGFDKVNDPMPWAKESEAAPAVDDATDDTEALSELWREFFTMITVQYQKGPGFVSDDSWKLTDEGKKIAKKLLTPIAKELSTRQMGNFTEEDLETVFKAAFDALNASKATPDFVEGFFDKYTAIVAPPAVEDEDEGWDDDDDDWGSDDDEDEDPSAPF